MSNLDHQFLPTYVKVLMIAVYVAGMGAIGAFVRWLSDNHNTAKWALFFAIFGFCAIWAWRERRARR